MFHPGETVVHTFIIPFERSSISQIIVSYKQNDHIILERIITSAMLNPDNPSAVIEEHDNPAETKFRVALSQEESLLFEDKKDYKIQLNVYSEGGSRHASCELNGSSGVQHHRDTLPEVIPHG